MNPMMGPINEIMMIIRESSWNPWRFPKTIMISYGSHDGFLEIMMNDWIRNDLFIRGGVFVRGLAAWRAHF